MKDRVGSRPVMGDVMCVQVRERVGHLTTKASAIPPTNSPSSPCVSISPEK